MKKRLILTINQELSKNILKVKTDVLVVGVNEDKALNPLSQKIDNATNGIIKKLIKRKELSIDGDCFRGSGSILSWLETNLARRLIIEQR